MRIAVMSDTHGFNLALKTVLADIDQQGPFDQIVIAGDLCEGGPDPAGVIAMLEAREIVAVHGNTDRDIVRVAGEKANNGDEDRLIDYTIAEIGPDGVEYLAALPFSHRITPPGGQSPDNDLLIVHANPHDVDEPLDPKLSDVELQAIIGDERAAALAFGHIHICYIRQVEGMLLVDVSAVGNPKDTDLRCKYGILTWDEERRTWSAELRKLEYPLDATLAQIRASNLPNPEKAIKKLLKASYDR